MMQNAIEWLYPRRCPVCDSAVPYGTQICAQCYPKLPRIKGEYCVKCGKPLLKQQREYCTDCKEKTHFYEAGRALYVYEGVIKTSIYRMKYGSRREYADFYGKQMAKHLGTFIKSTKAQAIIPVPLADKKKKQRGYNQAECLAEALSKITKIPVIDDLVVRVRDTAPQKQLDEQQRQNNLKKAFKIGRNDVKLNITIIIDDIYTTGSTIDAVACALSEVGVERIYYVALAIGKQ